MQDSLYPLSSNPPFVVVVPTGKVSLRQFLIKGGSSCRTAEAYLHIHEAINAIATFTGNLDYIALQHQIVRDFLPGDERLPI